MTEQGRDDDMDDPGSDDEDEVEDDNEVDEQGEQAGGGAVEGPNQDDDDDDDDDDDGNEIVVGNNYVHNAMNALLNNAIHMAGHVAREGTALLALHGNTHPPMIDIYGYFALFGVGPSTWEAMKYFYKHWREVCPNLIPGGWPLLQDRPYFGIGVLSSRHRPIHNPSIATIDKELIALIFQAFALLPNVSDSLMTRLKTWLNWHVKYEAKALGVAIAQEFSVSHVEPTVTTICTRVREAEAIAAREIGIDMQALLEKKVKPKQQIALMLSGLKTDNARLKRRDPLYRLTFCAMFSKGFLTLKRGCDYRGLTYEMLYTAPMEGVGPDDEYNCGWFISRHGKTNREGKLETMGFLHHYNPLLGASGWDGLVFLHRHCIMLEAFIDVNDIAAFQRLPLYRSSRDRTKRMNKSVMDNLYVVQYNVHGIYCDKVCHQPRKQGQQYLDSRHVSLSQIARHAGHKASGEPDQRTKTQEVYVTGPALDASIELAGGNHRYPECFDPGWAQVQRSTAGHALLTRLVDAALPALPLAEARCAVLVAECNGDPRLKAERKLVLTEGFLRYVRFAVESAFLMLAARQMRRRNGRGEWMLIANEPTHYELSDRTNRRTVFSLQIFQTAEFQQLTGLVATAQERQMNTAINVPPQVETALVNRIQNTFIPFLTNLDTRVSTINDSQQVITTVISAVALLCTSLLQQPAAADAAGAPAPNIAIPPALVQRVLGILQPLAQQLFGNNIPGLAQPPTAAVAAVAPPAIPIAAMVGPQPYADHPLFVRWNGGTPIFAIAGQDHSTGVADYWECFDVGRNRIPAYKRMEKRWGTRWRPFPNSWWGQRRPIFALVLHFKKAHPDEHIDQVIHRASVVYDTGRRNGRRSIGRSNAAVRAFLTSEGADIDRLLQEHVEAAVPADLLVDI